MTGPDRRDAIADAAIRLIARNGVRALTHRAIDLELGIAAGSTSYYARTRRELIAAVVHRLAARTGSELPTLDGLLAPAALAAPAAPEQARPPAVSGSASQVTPELAARLLAQEIETMAANRPDDHLARFALLIELRGDEELHAKLGTASPVRERLIEAAAGLLAALGADHDRAAAADLVAVVDALLFDRIAGTRSADPSAILLRYLSGAAS